MINCPGLHSIFCLKKKDVWPLPSFTTSETSSIVGISVLHPPQQSFMRASPYFIQALHFIFFHPLLHFIANFFENTNSAIEDACSDSDSCRSGHYHLNCIFSVSDPSGAYYWDFYCFINLINTSYCNGL